MPGVGKMRPKRMSLVRLCRRVSVFCVKAAAKMLLNRYNASTQTASCLAYKKTLQAKMHIKVMGHASQARLGQ